MSEEHNLVDSSVNRLNLRAGKLEIKAGPGNSIQITDDAGNGIQIAPGGAVTLLGTGSLPAAGVTSFDGRTGAVVPTSGDYLVAQVTGAAPLASPALTGNPTAPTQAPVTNSTRLATSAYVDEATDQQQVLVVQLTAAQIKALANTGTPAAALVLIPAQGAGTQIIVDNVVADWQANTLTYTTGTGALQLVYKNSTPALFTIGQFLQSALLVGGAGSSAVATTNPVMNGTTSGGLLSAVGNANVAVCLSAGAAYLNGDGVVNLRIKYRVLTGLS